LRNSTTNTTKCTRELVAIAEKMADEQTYTKVPTAGGGEATQQPDAKPVEVVNEHTKKADALVAQAKKEEAKGIVSVKPGCGVCFSCGSGLVYSVCTCEIVCACGVGAFLCASCTMLRSRAFCSSRQLRVRCCVIITGVTLLVVSQTDAQLSLSSLSRTLSHCSPLILSPCS
jgi:hypothetical protein